VDDPKDLIEKLKLQPHPEGGWYAETHRDAPEGGGRGSVTQIFYLLEKGQRSAWHRVTDATEIWHHYAGGPLELLVSPDGRSVDCHVLGGDLMNGEASNAVVPPNCWQSAAPLEDWVLCGCSVAPAFEFSSFEMAPDDWEPEGWTPK
jgi:predicted cupin superfamily sugar epimerase